MDLQLVLMSDQYVYFLKTKPALKTNYLTAKGKSRPRTYMLMKVARLAETESISIGNFLSLTSEKCNSHIEKGKILQSR